jgi:hypothetical protein
MPSSDSTVRLWDTAPLKTRLVEQLWRQICGAWSGMIMPS